MAREHTTSTADRSKTADSATRTPQNRGATSAVLQRLEQAPQTLRPADVLQLQRTIGNRATGQLLQAKLKLGPAGDRYEQEADRVAKQVVSASRQPDVQRADLDEDDLQAKPLAAGISQVQRDSRYAGVSYSRPEPRPTPQTFIAPQQKPQVQREEMDDELQASPNHGLEGGDVDTDVARSIQSAKGGGQPLHDGVRSSMERGFGADFGGVRVHTGGQADALNRSLNARAFTTGKDIFFGKGQYNPGSTGGQELIAHELTHTVQQGAAGVRNGIQRQEVIQRLTVQNTLWGNATDVRASGGGAGGVLFISDGQAPVVVKPGIHSAEEQLASHLHAVVSGQGQTNDGWNIQALDVRIADGNDITGIRDAVNRVFGNGQRPDRLNNLVNRLAAGSTMIQSPAQQTPGQEGTVGDRLAEVGQSDTGHTQKRKGHRTRVRDESPLKTLLNEPGLSITMGRAAATDVFLGNFDRFIGSANYENWMMDTQQKRIFLIDNVVDEAKARFEPWAQGGAFGQQNQQGGWQRQDMPQFNYWANNGAVTLLANAQFQDLATAIWSPSLSDIAMQAGISNSMRDELVQGQTAGDDGEGFVKQGERDAVLKKLTREKHFNTLVNNFAIGLQQGLIAVLGHNGGYLPNNLPVSQGVKVMYRARVLRMQGIAPQNCLAQAKQQVGGLTLL